MTQSSVELSVEYFPPQTPEGLDKLRVVREKLAVLEPTFCSVTYGAGGSTRERTFTVVKEIAAEGFDAAIHYGRPDWPDADHLLLMEEEVQPVCAPAFLPAPAWAVRLLFGQMGDETVLGDLRV